MSDVLMPKEYEAASAILIRRFVKFDAAGKVVQASAVGDDIVGVSALGVTSQDITDGKDRIRIDHLGKSDVTAGAAISPGQRLTTDANGKAVPAAPATGVNNSTGGYALSEAATADNDIIPMMVQPGVIQGAYAKPGHRRIKTCLKQEMYM